MSLSVQVQFVRNLACVIKSLNPTHPLLNIVPGLNLPPPLNRVTAIGLTIGLTQLAAVIFNFIGFYVDSLKGYRNHSRSKQLLVLLDRLSLDETTSSSSGRSHYTILRHGLRAEQTLGKKMMFIGFCELLIGITFLFLTANSFLLHGPTHPRPVINALIVMEIALAYLLSVMWKGLVNKLVCYVKTRNLADKLSQLKDSNTLTKMQIVTYAADQGYLGNMMDVCNLFDPSFQPAFRGGKVVTDCLKEDLQKIQQLLAPSTANKENTADEPEVKIMDLVTTLRARATRHLFDSMMDINYFLLNFIAGYGYLMGILAFYFPKASLSSKSIFDYVAKVLMLNLSNKDADWYGNFVGDLAWTIEPVLIMLQPILASLFVVSEKKQQKSEQSKKRD